MLNTRAINVLTTPDTTALTAPTVPPRTVPAPLISQFFRSFPTDTQSICRLSIQSIICCDKKPQSSLLFCS